MGRDMTQQSVVEIGSYVVLNICDDSGAYYVKVEHWDEIDAALHQFIERRIDRVLALTLTNGAELLVPASRMGEASLCTPETREMTRRLDSARKAEDGFEEA